MKKVVGLMLLLGLAAGGCWQKQEETTNGQKSRTEKNAPKHADNNKALREEEALRREEEEAIRMLERLISGEAGNENDKNSYAWLDELDRTAGELVSQLAEAERTELARAAGMGEDLFAQDAQAYELTEENAHFAWSEDQDFVEEESTESTQA